MSVEAHVHLDLHLDCVICNQDVRATQPRGRCHCNRRLRLPGAARGSGADLAEPPVAPRHSRRAIAFTLGVLAVRDRAIWAVGLGAEPVFQTSPAALASHLLMHFRREIRGMHCKR